MKVSLIVCAGLLLGMLACNSEDVGDADANESESETADVSVVTETDTTTPACSLSMTSKSCTPTTSTILACTYVSGACTCAAGYVPLANYFCWRGKK